MFRVLVLICAVTLTVLGEQVPQLRVYQEGVKNEEDAGSKVTITVGEKNGFVYTVNGYTASPFRITVAGDYYNDEAHHDGFARLYLTANPAIAFYDMYSTDYNVLQVSARNPVGATFLFEVICPYPVQTANLYEGQINQTTILVTGPSRSAVPYYGGQRAINLKPAAKVQKSDSTIKFPKN